MNTRSGACTANSIVESTNRSGIPSDLLNRSRVVNVRGSASSEGVTTSTILLSAAAKIVWGVRSCPRVETVSRTKNRIHARINTYVPAPRADVKLEGNLVHQAIDLLQRSKRPCLALDLIDVRLAGPELVNDYP